MCVKCIPKGEELCQIADITDTCCGTLRLRPDDEVCCEDKYTKEHYTVIKSDAQQDSCCTSLYRDADDGVPYISATEKCNRASTPPIITSKLTSSCGGIMYDKDVDKCCKRVLLREEAGKRKGCCGLVTFFKANQSCCDDVVTDGKRYVSLIKVL